jgi:vancomycin permeability regulator SanA
MIKGILKLSLLLLALYLLAALVLMIAGLREDYAPGAATVGVVFGNKVEPSGQPSASLASRLDKAVLLFNQGTLDMIIVSGGTGKEGWNEADVMADYLVARGIPRGEILLDREGNNTYLTALHTKQLAEQYNLHSFVVITHFYHVPRARLTFARLGLTPVTAAHSDRFVARDFYYGLMREVIAYPSYLLRNIE